MASYDEDTSTTSGSTCNTPPSTVQSEAETIVGEDTDKVHDPKENRDDTVPWPGFKYIINRANTTAVLVLEHGRLKLSEAYNPSGGGHHWTIEWKPDNHLGLRNSVDGSYFGHDGQRTMISQAKEHSVWERLHFRKHPSFGYVIATEHWGGWQYVGLGQDGETLVRTAEADVTWEFTKV